MNKKEQTVKWVGYIEYISDNIYNRFKKYDKDEAQILKDYMIIILYDSFSNYYFSGDILNKECILFCEYYRSDILEIIEYSDAYNEMIYIYDIFKSFYSQMELSCVELQRYEAANNIKIIGDFFNKIFKDKDHLGLIEDNI